MTYSLAIGPYAIALSPEWPISAIIILAVLLLLLAGFAAWRRSPGVLWRLGAGFILLALLLQPSLIAERRDYKNDIAILLVDRSESQDLADRRRESDRAIADLKAKFAKLEGLDLKIIESRPDKKSAEKGTRLFTALANGIADLPRQRIAGIVAITDGEVHDLPADWGELGLAAPFHVLLTGDPQAGDRRIAIEEAPGFGLVGQKIAIKIRAEDLGRNGGGSVAIELRRDGETLPPVTLPLGEAATIELPIDHGGETIFELRVPPGPQELTLANNSAILAIHGVRDRLRVLLVSGEPYPGERVWRNLLKSDPAVDLIHFTILRPPNKQDSTPINELALIAFPIDELFDVKLRDFDLIIFDRFQHLDILPEEYFRHIVDYVKEGGAVLESAGPSSAGQFSLYRTPMAEIFAGLPTGEVLSQGFQPALSELGRKHPVTAGLIASGGDAEKDWGRWFRQVAMRNDRGQVLMTGADNLPLLILDRIGKGRVAQIASDQLWLWSKGFEGGGPQGELIRRIAHWLMQEPDLEEEALRATAIDERIEIERRSLGEAAKIVIVKAPDGSESRVPLEPAAPGIAKATIPAEATGLYRIDDGTHKAFAAIGAVNSLEFSDPRSSPEKLLPLTRASGGAMTILAQTRDLPDLRLVDPAGPYAGGNWLGFKRNGDYSVSGIDRHPLLPEWLGLALALGLIFLAWRREGR